MPGATILLISSDHEVAAAASAVISAMGHELHVVKSLDEADRLQLGRRCDVLMVQVDSLDAPSRERLASGHLFRSQPPVIALARRRSIRDAVNCIRAGAAEYLSVWPMNPHSLEEVLHRALSCDALGQARIVCGWSDPADGFLTADHQVLELWHVLMSAADSTAPILLEGETGTGKTLLAVMVHQNSARRFGPFLELSCSGLADTLLESELFGHARGAFTSAYAERAGKWEMADGGTLFLDDIDSASPALQTRLLRAVESGEFERVGGTRTLRSDVRLLAATSKPLEEMVKKGLFREDLYHRLNGIACRIPPLRERVVDIPLLARHFLHRLSRQHRRHVVGITPEALDRMVRYPWPGNVRELRNAVEHGVIMAQGDQITLESLPRRIAEFCATIPTGQRVTHTKPLREALREPERQCILHALNVANGNKLQAASELGISRSTLYKKLKDLGLDQEKTLFSPRSAAMRANNQRRMTRAAE